MYLKKEDEIRIIEALKNKSIIICKEINELHYICDVIKNKYNIQCNNLKKEDNVEKNYVILYNNCTKKFQYEVYGTVMNSNIERESSLLWSAFSKENAILLCEKLNEYNIKLDIKQENLDVNLIVYKTRIN